MDPFQALSPEVLLYMLLSCDTFEGAFSLSKSSPAAFNIWKRHWHLIAQEFITHTNLNVSDHLQDYMALIFFPVTAEPFHVLKAKSLNTTESSGYRASKKARVESVEAHLYRWGEGKLPNPFESRNTLAAIDLLNLHSHLQLYIEDFLGKSTQPWLRRSYRYIPKWAHADFSQDFSNEWLDKSAFDYGYDTMVKLTAEQRRRVYRGFLRHELLCKIYSPLQGEALVSVVRPPIFKTRDRPCRCEGGDSWLECIRCRRKWRPEEWFDPADPFRHWDWNILERYEGTPTTLSDKRLFIMVREYVKNVYIALMQNELQQPIEAMPIIMPGASLLNWGQVPLSDLSIPYGCIVVPSLRRPQIQLRLRKLGVRSRSEFDDLLEFVTSAGFDILTAILLGSRDDLHVAFHTLGKELSIAEPNQDTTNIIHYLNAPCEQCGIHGRLPSERSSLRNLTAWPVFNSPEEPDPVDRSEVLIAEEGAMFDNRPEAYCLHESTCGMTGRHDIKHAGGFAIYPSLSSKMVPFWRQTAGKR